MNYTDLVLYFIDGIGVRFFVPSKFMLNPFITKELKSKRKPEVQGSIHRKVQAHPGFPFLFVSCMFLR